MKTVSLITLLLALVKSIHAADPEIAWGEPVDGLSLGLFFPKSEFGWAEPVTAIVMLRNDSTKTANLLNSPLPAPTDLFHVFASGSDRTPLPQRSNEVVTGYSGGMYPLLPGNMVAYELNLRDFLSIPNPDQLVVTVKRLLPSRREAVSGNGTVRISAGDSPPRSVIPDEIQRALTAGKPKYGGGSVGLPASPQAANNAPNTDHGETTSMQKRSAAFPRNMANEIPNISESTVGVPLPLANTRPVGATRGLNSREKAGMMIIVGLVTVLLFVLWRAAGRNTQT